MAGSKRTTLVLQARDLRLLEALETMRVIDRQQAEVVGIEFAEDAAAAARQRLDQVTTGDVEQLELAFPPQSFGEEAFIEQSGAETPPKPPPSPPPRPDQIPPPPPEPVPPLPSSRIRMAGRSRIAFTMPAEETSLEFTLVAILDACRRWPMSLDINAAPDPEFSIGVLGEIFEHDWLAVLVSSENWRQTTDALIGGIGGGDALRQPLANAARRLAFRAS